VHLIAGKFVELVRANASMEFSTGFFDSKSELVLKGRKATYRIADKTTSAWTRSASGRNRDLLQERHIVERVAGAACGTGQRIVGHPDGQLRHVLKKPVEAAQECAAAGQYHALLDDVGRELRRRPLQTRTHRLDDGHHRLAQRLADLLVGDDERLRHAVD